MIKSVHSKTVTKPDVEFVGAKLRSEVQNKLRIGSIFNKFKIGPYNGESSEFYDGTIQIYGGYDLFLPRGDKPDNQVIITLDPPPTNDSFEISGRRGDTILYADIVFTVNNDPIAGFFRNQNYLSVSGIDHYYLLESDYVETVASYYVKVINSIVTELKSRGYKRIKKWTNKKRKVLQIGSDPEWSFFDTKTKRAKPANTVLHDNNNRSKLGLDGASHTGEFRPSPCDDPIKLVNNELKPLLRELMGKTPSGLIVTSGGGTEYPLGGHIHFNKKLSAEEITLLDDFIGKPTTQMKGGKRAGGGYGKLGDVRDQPHGCEYRTPPSTLIPGICEAQYVTAFLLVRAWEMLAPGQSINYDIREDGIPSLESYIQLAPLPRLEPYLRKYHEWLTTGEYDPRQDILALWFNRNCPATKATTNQTTKPRVIVESPQDWYKGPKKVSVRGLNKEAYLVIDNYSPSYIEGNWENIPDKAVIVEVPEATGERFNNNEHLFEEFCSGLSDKLDTDIAIVESEDEELAAIRIPHTWRSKRNLLTSKVVKQIARQLFTN